MANNSNQQTQRAFKQFRLGGSLFFVGLVIIYGAHQTMADSLAQELVMLLGVVILAVGFILAIVAEVRILLVRLLDFFRSK